MTASVLATSDSFGPSAYRSSQEVQLSSNDVNSIKLAFGSCYGIRDKKSNIFETIVKDEPDVWIWLGDVAYVDGADYYSIIFGAPMDKDYVIERF